MRGKLSQGTEAKELDTHRLTKHCGWKRSIYWSANFLHSNRDAAPADRPATNTTGSLNPIEADVKRAQQLLLSLLQPHRGAANPPSQLEKNRGGRTGVGMVGGLPSVAGLLCLVPAFSCGYLEGDEQGTARSHAQMVMLGNPAEIGIHVDPPRAWGHSRMAAPKLSRFKAIG